MIRVNLIGARAVSFSWDVWAVSMIRRDMAGVYTTLRSLVLRAAKRRLLGLDKD